MQKAIIARMRNTFNNFDHLKSVFYACFLTQLPDKQQLRSIQCRICRIYDKLKDNFIVIDWSKIWLSGYFV
jgi:hypothetical protein